MRLSDKCLARSEWRKSVACLAKVVLMFWFALASEDFTIK